MTDGNIEVDYEYELLLGKTNECGFPEIVTCVAKCDFRQRYDFSRYLKKGKPNKIELMFLGGVLM